MATPFSSPEPQSAVRVAGWQVLVMIMMVVGVFFSFYKAGTGSDYYTEDAAAASAPAQVAAR